MIRNKRLNCTQIASQPCAFAEYTFMRRSVTLILDWGGRCGGAEAGGAAAAQPNEWIPAPSIACNHHHCY